MTYLEFENSESYTTDINKSEIAEVIYSERRKQNTVQLLNYRRLPPCLHTLVQAHI